MVRQHRLLQGCVAAAVLVAGSYVHAASYEVVLNTAVRYQTIDGWGAETTVSDTQSRLDYANLGMNMLRVYASKNVLVHSSSDYLTPVPLTSNMASNIAKFNFTAGGMDAAGNMAKWLSQNALYPSRVKINTDSFSPPAWMKGPDGTSSDWIGNANNSVGTTAYPTPWLSNQHNGYELPSTSNTGDSIGGRLVTEDANNLQQFGYYLASWVAGFQQKYGVSVYSMNMQNESTFENPFDSMTLIKDANGTTDYTQYALALENAKQAWSTFGLTTKILGPGTARVGDSPSNPFMLNNTMNMIQAVKNFSADPSLLSFLGIYGSNFYMGANENSTDMLAAYWNGKQNVSGVTFASYLVAPGVQNDGKPVWFTETGDGGTAWLQSANTPGTGAISVALNIYNALIYSNASAYEYYEFEGSGTTADQYSLLGTGDISNPTKSKKYDAFKQMSRYILPGAQRISATFKTTGTSVSGSDQYDSLDNVDVTAFIDDLDKMVTVVLLNMQTGSNTITIDIPANLLNGSMQVYFTDANNNFVQGSDLTAVNNKLTLTMGAFSIYTLVGATGVPEPASVLLLGVGLTSLLRRRRQ